jgi:hypothetical protein
MPSMMDVIIDNIVATPPYLSPALDHELESIVRAAINEFCLLILGPSAERILPLVIQSQADGNASAPS